MVAYSPMRHTFHDTVANLTDVVRRTLTTAPVSVNALARAAGVSQSLLARIRSGERTATPVVARAIARALERRGAECIRAARVIRQAARHQRRSS